MNPWDEDYAEFRDLWKDYTINSRGTRARHEAALGLARFVDPGSVIIIQSREGKLLTAQKTEYGLWNVAGKDRPWHLPYLISSSDRLIISLYPSDKRYRRM